MTTPKRFSENPAYLEHEKLLKQLQDLNQEGKNDSDEADVIRDKMEAPWNAISDEEQARQRGLSADLYSLSDEEEPTELTPEEEKQLRADCDRAFRANEWETLLGLMRRGPQLFPKEFLAAWRARCWHELGHFFPACWFWLEAFRFNPTDRHYQFSALYSLAQMDPKRALSETQTVLSSERAPRVVFGAARVLLSVAKQLPKQEAIQLYETISEYLNSALKEESQQNDADPDLVFIAHINLSAALELSGKTPEARKSFDELVEKYPEREESLLLRAVFLLKHEPKAATRDLDLLIQRKTHFVEAYGHRAQQMLRDKNFSRCSELCDQALQRQPNRKLRAALLEWKAICLAELGHAPQTVKAYFQRALEADPFNENIRRNLAVFEKRLTKQTQRPEYDIPAVAIPSPAEFFARIAA